jgi:hypothetical protein
MLLWGKAEQAEGSGTLGNVQPNQSHRKHVIKRPKTRYQAPDPKNTLPSTRKHKTHHQKPFPQALTERVLAFQPPWARFTGSRR